MPSSITPRKRAVATSGTTIGSTRYNLYKQAYSRIHDATKQGFYLEAITIIESLVSDRLESRLTFLKKHDFSFKTLGGLIKESRKTETDSALKELVANNLDKWRDDRNHALHEMAKLADGDSTTWEDRVKGIVPVAVDGLTILRAIDKRCKELRKLDLKNRHING